MSGISRLLTLLVLAHFTIPANAVSSGCLVPVNELESQATDLVKDRAEKGLSLDNSLSERTRLNYTYSKSKGEKKLDVVFEGFFRPLSSAAFSLLPLPILAVELDRSRHLFYICAEKNDAIGREQVTVYFLKGYDLDPLGFNSSFIGDLLFGPKLRVTPVTINAVNSQAVGMIFDLFDAVPIVNIITKIPQMGLKATQAAISRALGTFAGLGVERIVLTAEELELATGVDLENPESARHRVTINFKKFQESDGEPEN